MASSETGVSDRFTPYPWPTAEDIPMTYFSPVKFVVTIAIVLPLTLLCRAAGFPLDWLTTAGIAVLGFGAGSVVDRLYNRNRGAEIAAKARARRTEDFLAKLERGSDTISFGAR